MKGENIKVKKFLSMILALAMVIAIIPCSVMADGDTVISITAGPGYQVDVNHNGMVVTPQINVVSGEMPAGYKYQWYAQDGNSTEYLLPWETGASITINAQIPAGWWLNFEATPLDSEGNAIGGSVKSNHYISTYPLKGRTDYPSITAEQSAAYHDTPSEYTFEVDGVKFILLDRVWSGEYYVMMEESVGKRQFDTSGAEGKQFYATSETHLAHWLNSTESGSFLDGTYLPSSVQSHITEENWIFEGDGNWGGNTRTLKVGLLSYSEYLAYFGRFGLWLSAYNSADPTGWEGWWLRTLNNNQKVFASFKNGGTTNGSGIMGKLNRVNANDANYHVRPTFHLDANFFKDVKVTLAGTGDKVKETMVADCTREELGLLYTDDEMAEIDPSMAFPYEVKRMIVRDKLDGSTAVSLDLVRYGEDVNDEYIFIAAYKDNKLTGVKASPVDLEQGEYGYVSENLGILEDGYDEIKVFCLDPSVMKPASRLMTLSDAKLYSEAEGEDAVFCEIVLPDTIYGVAGREMNIYFENSVYSNDLKDYQVDVECSYGIQQQERWTYTPESAQNFNLTLNIYQDAIRLVTSKTVSVKVVESSQHSVWLDGADNLLANAVAERMTVSQNNPDTIVLVVGDSETKQEIASRISALKASYAGVKIGIVPPITPIALSQLRMALIDDIYSLVDGDSSLFFIPAGWNVDGVYSCDENGINEAGAQQAADVILAAVCDKGGSAR